MRTSVRITSTKRNKTFVSSDKAWVVLNVKALEAGVGAFNPVKALVGAFSVIMNLRMDLIQALILIVSTNNIYWCVLEIPDGLLRPQ